MHVCHFFNCCFSYILDALLLVLAVPLQSHGTPLCMVFLLSAVWASHVDVCLCQGGDICNALMNCRVQPHLLCLYFLL
jgi:hypothetical protein